MLPWLSWTAPNVYRTFLHDILSDISNIPKPNDKILDVGAGRNESYRHLFPSVTTVDVVEDNSPDICCDISKKIPIDDNSVKYVLAMNVLEHIYNHRSAIKEIYRVLEPNGILWGFVPFMINIHGDPNDYYRYTPEALKRLLSDCGFSDIETKELRGAPLLIAQLCSFLPFMWRLTNPIFRVARFLSNRKNDSNFSLISHACVLAIFFSASKS